MISISFIILGDPETVFSLFSFFSRVGGGGYQGVEGLLKILKVSLCALQRPTNSSNGLTN